MRRAREDGLPFVLAVVLLLAAAACGVKGAPRPPRPEAPTAAEPLELPDAGCEFCPPDAGVP